MTTEWLILLTMCVNTGRNSTEEQKERIDMYTKSINQWLDETSFRILVIESSGYEFKEIKRNDKLTIISFEQECCGSSTIGERNSIIFALSYLNENSIFNDCRNIFKVTGRYFLQDIQNVLDNLDPNYDLYLQVHRHSTFQNSEYFGIKRELFLPFLSKMDFGAKIMEYRLFEFSLDKQYTTIGPFHNTVRRGGDNMLINLL
jgi:hypothetical protein